MPTQRRASDIFCEIIEMAPESRAAYLERTCADSPSLRAEVESLLDAHARGADGFLGRPLEISESGSVLSELACDIAPGARIGPYEIIRRLASGGMATVYLAQRIDDVFRKQVAIKLIHPSLWGSEAVARFRLERQVLADLEHPGIARLIDGGTTADGLPYLAMEFVDGVPIDAFCEEGGLGVAARLALFLETCEAVRYAHHHLVIHRDLKPSNILVDRSGHVKLLDFGIAKVISGEGADGGSTTVGTPLTPLYASPEQLSGRRMTTATDIYSLGVVLYRLLTGAFPFDWESRSVTQMARTIAEEEPIRPSRRAGTGTSRQLTGDLDMILLKALNRDPTRRYATVDAFAADVRRQRAGLPVLARPDTAMYRASKFVARNRLLVASTGGAVAVVVTALVATLAAYHQATGARREAEWHAYVASLAAAEAALREDRIDEAASYLAAAPEGLRSWEWRHLQSRLDHSVGTFEAHGAGVTQMCFLPDGERLVTCSVDSTIRVWKGTTGTLIREYGPFSSGVESAAPVVGTELIALGLNEGRVLLVDLTDGERAVESAKELLPSGPAWAFVSASPDGRRLACGFFDGMVRVWTMPTGSLLAEWKAHDGLAFPVFSPDGSLLATGGGNGRIILYDGRTFGRIDELPGHARRVYRMAFSPDGSRLVSASMDRTASVWSVHDASAVRTFREHHATITAIAFAPDGDSVVTAGGDNRLLCWSVSTGEVRGELRGHVSDVTALAAQPDGTRLVSGDWGGVAKIWRWGTQDVLSLTVTTGWMIARVYGAAWDRDETKLACASNGGMLPIWTRSGEPSLIAAPEPMRCVAFSSDGSLVLTGNEGGELVLFDAVQGTVVRTVAAHDGAILGMAIDPDGAKLATASEDSTVKLWSLPDVVLVSSLRHDGAVEDVEFSPRGDVLASCDRRGTIRLGDAASGRPLRSVQAGESAVHDLGFDPSGSRLASVSDDGVRLWDVAGLRQTAAFPARGAKMRSVAWSGSGARIAAGGSDGLVHLFDLMRGREVMTLHGHVSGVTSVRFGRDDAFLTSTSLDGTVRIWDTEP